MSISFENAVGMRATALGLRAERASVLSSNLANMDTPNFKARDINFQSEFAARMGSNSTVRLHGSNAGHMSFSNSASGTEQLYRTPTQPSIDGNSVEEHVEHAEFMKNNLEFQVAFTMLNSSFKGLTKAIRGE
jgi:flagellar basal-body rod protein FlgB